jgi:hypothetical protein
VGYIYSKQERELYSFFFHPNWNLRKEEKEAEGIVSFFGHLFFFLSLVLIAFNLFSLEW